VTLHSHVHYKEIWARTCCGPLFSSVKPHSHTMSMWISAAPAEPFRQIPVVPESGLDGPQTPCLYPKPDARYQRACAAALKKQKLLTDYSQVDSPSLRYQPVKFEAGKSQGSPNRFARIDWISGLSGPSGPKILGYEASNRHPSNPDTHVGHHASEAPIEL